VEELLTMDEALAAVEEAFRLQGVGKADNHPRQRPKLGHATLQVMPAAVAGMGFGLKAYTVASGGVRFVVLLWDEETGNLEAAIEAGLMGQMRTGAASGVATRYLARPDAATVGMFGTGTQAPTQLEAVCAVRPIERVWVYSRKQEHRERFAAEMSDRLGVAVEAAASPGMLSSTPISSSRSRRPQSLCSTATGCARAFTSTPRGRTERWRRRSISGRWSGRIWSRSTTGCRARSRQAT
jgi:ornithine cyclodeaminase/alanine dehydrogenase